MRFSLVYLYRRFSAFANWSLGFMAKRSIRYPAMGDRFSRHEGDQRGVDTEYDSFDTEYDSTWEDDDDDCPETQSSEVRLRYFITFAFHNRRQWH